MSPTAAIPSSPTDAPSVGEVAYFTHWLRELDECHRAGLVTPEDHATQRAERLSEILLRPRHLWLAWLVAILPLAALTGGTVWLCTHDLQRAALSAGLGALFGCAMLGRASAEKMRQYQLRNRLHILHTLLAQDLLTAQELIAYEERMK